MALNAKSIREQTAKLLLHYDYLLDELELAAQAIERETDLLKAHRHDIAMKDVRIAPDTRKKDIARRKKTRGRKQNARTRD